MELSQDIKSQIKRAKELLVELKEQVDSDLTSHDVSDKARNLTQEILVKMKSVFDQSMYQFFDFRISSTLSNEQKNRSKVYFPMVPKREDLNAMLGRAHMGNLENDYPEIFTFVDSVQSYNTDFEWMEHFSKFANEKHIRLTPQKRNETKSIFIGKGGTGIRITGNASIKMGSNTSMNIGGVNIRGGQEINPDSNFILGDSNADVKKEIWVSFTLGDSNVKAYPLCNIVVIKGEKILEDFFKLF